MTELRQTEHETPLFNHESPISALEMELLGNTWINSHEKTGIVLVKLGLKPAANFSYLFYTDYEEYGPDFEDEYISSIKKTKEILKKQRIPFMEKHTKFVNSAGEGAKNEFFIGNNWNELNELITASEVDSSPEYDFAMGTALGYPQTAIEAYSRYIIGSQSEQMLDNGELPEEVRNKEYMKYLNFRLSRDHWQEELEVVKQSAEAIKAHTPALYSQIVAA